MADRYIPEHRRTQFKAKNAFKPEELRRRREEQQVEIRKTKREENLAKRRGIGTGERLGASLGAAPDSDDETAPTESQVSNFILVYPCFSAVAEARLRVSHPTTLPPSLLRPPAVIALLLLFRFPLPPFGFPVLSFPCSRERNAAKLDSVKFLTKTNPTTSTCVALTTGALLLSPAFLGCSHRCQPGLGNNTFGQEERN